MIGKMGLKTKLTACFIVVALIAGVAILGVGSFDGR